MNRRRTASGSDGFTLFEALIALALTSLIIGFIVMITQQWLPNWNRGLESVQRNDRFAMGMERLTSDLASALFIPIGGKNPLPVFDGTPHSVTLVRTALVPRGYPTLEVVQFAERADDHGTTLVRTRADFAPVTGGGEPDRPRFRDPVILIHSPARVSFSYAGTDRIWRDTWQGSTALPRAIRVMVRDANSERILAASTATLVHVDVPPDCITSKLLVDCLKSHSDGRRAAGPHRPHTRGQAQ